MTIEVRRLAEDEVARAPDLLAPEGWGFSEEELRRLHRLGGAVGALADGRLVGYLSFVDLPPTRWIGNVVVHEDARGAGVGARMVAETLRDAPSAGLYAVRKAVSLYERAGFRGEGDAIAMRAQAARPHGDTPTEPLRAEDLDAVARFDRDASGMDRAALLRELLHAHGGTARVVRDAAGRVLGYGVAKTSPDLTEIGPLVAIDLPTASAILDALLGLTQGPHEMTVLEASPTARALAESRGFAPAFRPLVMFRGEPPAWRPDRLYAAAGLEKG